MSNYNLKLILADGFYLKYQADMLRSSIQNLKWIDKQYGQELENFNLIPPNIDFTISKILDEPIKIDEERSGIFRKSMHTIHFEEFDSLNEWCFIIALEKCTFNIYKHISDNNGEVGIVDSSNALEGYKFNYKNFFEWKIETNIVLEPGQGIFFRPWIFHNIDGGLIQYYRILSDKHDKRKKSILVMGLPGSGKTTLAKNLSKELNATHINADTVRKLYNDQDFSVEGRQNQAKRMRSLANLSNTEYTICDFICPTQITRDYFEADFIIWMNTIEKSIYEDTNTVFEQPKADIVITDWNYDITKIIKVINNS